MSEVVIKEQEGRVAILTINRPDKLNALNQEVRDRVLELLDEIEHDESVGVVVLTGSGEKSFIAGADIAEFEGRSPFDQREAMRSPRIFDVMSSFPKPVIAMINGFALVVAASSQPRATFELPRTLPVSVNQRSSSVSSRAAEGRRDCPDSSGPVKRCVSSFRGR